MKCHEYSQFIFVSVRPSEVCLVNSKHRGTCYIMSSGDAVQLSAPHLTTQSGCDSCHNAMWLPQFIPMTHSMIPSVKTHLSRPLGHLNTAVYPSLSAHVVVTTPTLPPTPHYRRSLIRAGQGSESWLDSSWEAAVLTVRD